MAETELARLREAGNVAEHLTHALADAGRAMDALLGEDYLEVPGWRGPDGHSHAEDVAAVAADTLTRTAHRMLELHRVGDGPGIAEFSRACIKYAAALRQAASGAWPDDLDAINGELQRALSVAEHDARLVARGALRVHELNAVALRDAGAIGEHVAGRIDHEGMHELAELQRIAGARAASLF